MIGEERRTAEVPVSGLDVGDSLSRRVKGEFVIEVIRYLNMVSFCCFVVIFELDFELR